MIAQTLAHYRINAAVGAGGMGEVYRATDTKLGREVAIKVLPADFARDPDRLARFEREARLLAYVSEESGRREVYARALHGPERRWPISTDGGDEPVWSGRGDEIFYRRGSEMMVVPVKTEGGDLTPGAPAVLFEGRYDVDPFGQDATNYDVTPDGKRFVMVRRVVDPGRSRQQLRIVLNWFEDLKRLARAK